MKKHYFIIGGLIVLALAVPAYAFVNDIGGKEHEDNTPSTDNQALNIGEDMLGENKDIANDIQDTEVRDFIRQLMNKSNSTKLMTDTVTDYMDSNSYQLKINLDENAENINGLESLGTIQSLRIEGATNPNFDWSGLKKLTKLKSITVVNCKFSPSDISSYISYLIKNGSLEELYINAAFPGKDGEKFQQIEEKAQGLSGPYTSALNDLGIVNSNGNQLKILSLVGNDWQGDIASFQKLQSTGCQIALNENAHSVTEDDYRKSQINIIH